jgi:hypothetical protein
MLHSRRLDNVIFSLRLAPQAPSGPIRLSFGAALLVSTSCLVVGVAQLVERRSVAHGMLNLNALSRRHLSGFRNPQDGPEVGPQRGADQSPELKSLK